MNDGISIREAEKTSMQKLTPDQIDLIKSTICKGASDDELSLFIQVCSQTQLNPFTRQIYAVRTGGKLTFQVSIDGFRLVAQRSGEYQGQTSPQWCGPDGIWRDVWLESYPPAAARIGVYRKGFKEPTYGVARTDAYRQSTPTWTKMADVMIAKCAESLALRKSFPAELSGLYTSDEMAPASSNEQPTNAPYHEAEPQPRHSIAQRSPRNPVPIVIEDSTMKWVDKLAACETLDELEGIGAQIKSLNDDTRHYLRTFYRAAMIRIMPPQDENALVVDTGVANA